MNHPFRDSQFVSFMRRGTWVRASYSWFNSKLTAVCNSFGLIKLKTHSLRRGCATSLADAGFSILDIRNLGDWASLSVLKYISKTLDSKKDLNQ